MTAHISVVGTSSSKDDKKRVHEGEEVIGEKEVVGVEEAGEEEEGGVRIGECLKTLIFTDERKDE